MNIKTTTDYDQFKKLKGNRPVNKNHVAFLSKSIALNNMLAVHPIVVNEKMEVIDGQHRLEVARKNGWDIHYFVLKGAGMPETVLLNTYARTWSLTDWLNSYVALGYADYIILEKFVREHKGLSLSNAVSMFTPDSAYTQNITTARQFKLGYFKAGSKEYAENFMENLDRIDGLLAKMVRTDRDFIVAMIHVSKVIPLDELADKMVEVGKPVQRGIGVREYLHMLEDIINYKRKELVRLF